MYFSQVQSRLNGEPRGLPLGLTPFCGKPRELLANDTSYEADYRLLDSNLESSSFLFNERYD